MARNATDLTGQTFGRLLVRLRAENSKQGAARWAVRCSCGTEKIVRTDQLTSGNTVSCGCYQREAMRNRATTHGMTNSFEFRVWTAMRKRCSYKKHPRFYRYGGRGITVCEQWGSFEAFLRDMGPCPFGNGSIERIDNDKGYTPDNCVWIPKTQQSRNRSFTKGVKNGNT
jgi:hypothetical protein